MTSLLLDSHAALWLAEGVRLSAACRRKIDKAASSGGGVFLSPVTAWEIAQQWSRRRIKLPMPPLEWFRSFSDRDGFGAVDLAIETLVAAFDLPGTPPDDPADRFLIATARQHALRLVTRDALILAYGEAGHVLTLEC